MATNDTWIRRNITSIQSLFWSIAAVAIIIIVLFKDIKSDDKTTYLILSFLFGIVTFQQGYYFGATKALNDKMKSELETHKPLNNKENENNRI